MKVFILLTLLLSAISGCAPTYQNISGERFHFEEVIDNNKAQIYIYRTIAPPTHRSPDVIINGTKHFDLKPGGFGKINVSAGDYFIETKWGWDMLMGNKAVHLIVDPAETYFIRCDTYWTGLIYESTTQEVPKEMALFEMRGMRELPDLQH